jgi:hypothetical protein
MSSISSSLPASGTRLRRSSIFPRLADEGLLVTVVAFFCAMVASVTPYFLQPDSWLTFIGGREITAHGIPHTDSLALVSQGNAWIDQQWLAQLLTYKFFVAFGMGVTLAVSSLLVCVAFALACAFARRSASARSVVIFALLAIPFSFSSLRAQTVAYVFFVPFFAFLCSESRRPTRRLWLVLPLLAIWANLHGSVVVAAGLVGLLGVLEFARGARRRGAALALGAPACIFATPYGLGLLGYYHSTMGNPLFKKYISEWAPPTFPSMVSAVFLLAAGIGIVLIARRPRHLSRFEVAALFFLFLGGLSAERSIVWFSYAALLLLPGLLDRAWPPRPVGSRVRTVVGVTGVLCVAACAATGVYVLRDGSKEIRKVYPPAALQAVRGALAAHPNARLLADDRTADWLLYELPQLKGQIAFDGRWEVLTRPQFQAARDFIKQGEPHPEQYERGYQIFTVDPFFNKKLARSYAASGFRVLYSGRRVAVYER